MRQKNPDWVRITPASDRAGIKAIYNKEAIPRTQ